VNVQRILLEKPFGENPLGIPRRRWKKQTDTRGVECDGGKSIMLPVVSSSGETTCLI
jgi:hypothetical protein